MDMLNSNFDYYIGLNYAGSSSYKNFTIYLDLPSYVVNYGNYSIKYLIVVMDKTAISQDYPKYHFRALMTKMVVVSSSNNGRIPFTGLPDPNNRDNNYIMGITQY
jgi:hypothetical protein